jgi:hypothetical protein
MQTPARLQHYETMARAGDWSGQPQLEQYDPNLGTYLIHHSSAIWTFIDTQTPESGSSPARQSGWPNHN